MRGATIAGKVGYAASCLLAAVLLVLSGYAHRVNSLGHRAGQLQRDLPVPQPGR